MERGFNLAHFVVYSTWFIHGSYVGSYGIDKGSRRCDFFTTLSHGILGVIGLYMGIVILSIVSPFSI